MAVSAARSDTGNSAEQVAAQVAMAYLAAVKADADVETAQANVTLSQALEKQAEIQKAAGTGTGIEITRAKVQLANDRQHLLVVENARHNAHLQLLRAMNMRLDTEVNLTDKLQYLPVDAVTIEQAKAQALKERPDLKAQRGRPCCRMSNPRLPARAAPKTWRPWVSVISAFPNSGFRSPISWVRSLPWMRG